MGVTSIEKIEMMTNEEHELCGYESIILCVSTCVLCVVVDFINRV